MVRHLIRPISLLIIWALISAAALAAPQAQKPLTNADVTNMVKAGLPESTIIGAIQANPTAFDVSANGLIALKQAGVSQNIMDAMLAAETRKRNAPSATPGSGPTAVAAALPSQLHVDLLPPTTAPGTTASQAATPLTAEKTQLAQTKTKPSSLTGLAGDSTLNQALQSGINTATWEALSHTGSLAGSTAVSQGTGIFGSMMSRRKSGVTYVWALPGPTSSFTNVPASGGNFGVSFSGIAGVNPEEYEPVIVKLAPTPNNWRLVGATQGKEEVKSSSAFDWPVYSGFLEDRVPAETRKLGSGQYQISPSGTLSAGEYAIVLRPISKTKKFSGADVTSNHGDGMIFNSVWSFAVK
jgi:hypothetical protein